MTSHDSSNDPKEDGGGAKTDDTELGFAEQVVRSERRRKGRMIVGALAATGVFQLNGWQVQAHGNRSSHDTQSTENRVIGFGPDDYVLLRQQATAPNFDKTQELFKVTEQLQALSPTDAAYNNLEGQRLKLESELQLRRSTSKALKFIAEGDVPGAVAAVEGLGWPERVLGEYLWVLLDVAYLGSKGGRVSGAHTKEFVVLAKAAIDYSDRVLDNLPKDKLNPQEQAAKARVAEIFHNIAGFTIPDDGAPDPGAAKLGLDAAKRALELRTQLGSKPEIMRAHWMVGRQQLKAGNLEAAREEFNKAIRLAEQTRDQAGLVWSKIYLAKAQDPAKAKNAEKLLADVEKGVMKIDDPVLLEFLQLETDSIGEARLDEAITAAKPKQPG